MVGVLDGLGRVSTFFLRFNRLSLTKTLTFSCIRKTRLARIYNLENIPESLDAILVDCTDLLGVLWTLILRSVAQIKDSLWLPCVWTVNQDGVDCECSVQVTVAREHTCNIFIIDKLEQEILNLYEVLVVYTH